MIFSRLKTIMSHMHFSAQTVKQKINNLRIDSPEKFLTMSYLNIANFFFTFKRIFIFLFSRDSLFHSDFLKLYWIFSKKNLGILFYSSKSLSIANNNTKEYLRSFKAYKHVKKFKNPQKINKKLRNNILMSRIK